MLFAVACGLIVANLYYGQPLAGPIAAELGMSPAAAGLLVTLTQVGYGLGLLFIVPLGDILENRRLVLTLIACCALALLSAAMVRSAPVFLAAAAAIGFTSVTVQILVPWSAHLASDANRGRVVGNVMSGLLMGIMLARPVASFVASLWGWHAIYLLSAALMLALAVLLLLILPSRRPEAKLPYAKLLGSLWWLARTQPVLQRRALQQACLFGAFSLFWTTVPLFLASPAFGLSQRGIALFALAGVAGAVAAPISGRLADRGHGRKVSIVAMLMVAGGFLMSLAGQDGSLLALGLLTLAAIVLDYGVTANLITGQRAIFGLDAEYRSRLNGLFMASFFMGGAACSALGAWAYAHGGWTLACWVGFALPVMALVHFLASTSKR
ncbi:Predicted arabinose efflux permease, MFS family [Noviherbaspirillum suwonense]|uniref:Predicted arabinose efflux permease, MFS family n=2 Tax=Noviherbaspirillum suwonense TaxID=1224511 RepID=A0ABY1QQT1_9BURK|nr:Predicted arabinose efflux permease, MFS family [Noviherbaspirillum suwonense]